MSRTPPVPLIGSTLIAKTTPPGPACARRAWDAALRGGMNVRVITIYPCDRVVLFPPPEELGPYPASVGPNSHVIFPWETVSRYLEVI